MQFVDSHCHLDLIEQTENGPSIPTLLTEAEHQAVKYFLCVCVTLKDFPAMFAKINTYPNVWASVGLHPNEVADHEPSIEDIVQLARDKKVIAIGETGLDYYRTEGDVAFQHERFRRHIRAARQLNKPLIIHSRQAKADTIRLLKEEQADTVQGVMHCFTEDLEMAQAAIELGFYISFSGIVTFSNAKTLQTVAREIPLDRMLIETDSPWLAPVPHRGKLNQPAYVRHVAEFIATLRGVSLEEIAKVTTANFFKLFHVEAS
ncbi:MAG: TatD family hydrolase [Gammaproteobacteria bacterium]|nr:TatD family hydrolase [Gammaproteobacteria bacterium]